MSHVLTLEWEILCSDICILSTVTPAVLAKESVAANPLASAFAHCLCPLLPCILHCSLGKR